MSFGKKSSSSKVQLGNTYTPFGNVTISKKGNATFSPFISAAQQQGMASADAGIAQTIQNLPTQYDVNAAYNNPYYGDTLSLLDQPINTQYAQDSANLNNSLNAQNQGGGSYDAYSRSLLGQRYDQLYNQAQLQARQASSDAYNQNIQNGLNTLSALQDYKNAVLNNIYIPANLASAYQGNSVAAANATTNRQNQQQQAQYRNSQTLLGGLKAGSTFTGTLGSLLFP